jgi:hypothetical protein
MEKPFGSIRMDAEKKKRPKKEVKEYHACRVIPFSAARLGADGIRALPLITILPQEGMSIKIVIGKRRKAVAELIKELFGDDYGLH